MKRTIVILSSGLLALMLVGLFIISSTPDIRKLSQAEFTTFFQSNLLAQVRVYYPAKRGQLDGVPVMLHEVRGTFYQTDAGGQVIEKQTTQTELPFIARVQISDELLSKLARSTNFVVVSLNPVVQQVSERLHFSKP